MAMQITYQRIGGYLTRFFLLAGGLAAVLAALAVWAVLFRKWALHRLVLPSVLGFGLLYSFVLPPYAAPDEKYHINQSFTLACRWPMTVPRRVADGQGAHDDEASAASVTVTPTPQKREHDGFGGRRSPPSCSMHHRPAL